MTYVVADDDPLAGVLELPVVGGGAVAALLGTVLRAEGDRVAGARVDVSFHPGHHRVLAAWGSRGSRNNPLDYYREEVCDRNKTR